MPPKAAFLALISRAMRNLYSRSRVKMGNSVPAIAPGTVVFEVRNAGNRFAVFGVLQFPDATFQRPRIRFTPSLSGKRLLMTQTFRDFFRSEVIGATEGIAVRDVSLVSPISRARRRSTSGSAILTPTFKCSGTSSIFLTSLFGTTVPSPRRSATQ